MYTQVCTFIYLLCDFLYVFFVPGTWMLADEREEEEKRKREKGEKMRMRKIQKLIKKIINNN